MIGLQKFSLAKNLEPNTFKCRQQQIILLSNEQDLEGKLEGGQRDTHLDGKMLNVNSKNNYLSLEDIG